MAGILLEAGRQIYQYGQPMTALHLIIDGRVQVNYPGGHFVLQKGGVIGISEICSEIHFLEYLAQEDTSIVTYSIASQTGLEDLLEKHPDVARLFLLSAFYQINLLMEACSVQSLDCSSLYQQLLEDYTLYRTLCDRYRVTPRTLESFDSAEAYLGEEDPDFWLSSFYRGLAKVYSGEGYRPMVQDPAVSSGFLRKCSLDTRRTIQGLEEQERYRGQILQFYFQESGNDLFDFCTSLYYKLDGGGADAVNMRERIDRMLTLYREKPAGKSDTIAGRIHSYQENLERMHSPVHTTEAAPENAQILRTLAGSLNQILEYAGDTSDTFTAFRQNVLAFKQLPDRNATDDECSALRTQLTTDFYTLYLRLFERALASEDIPMPVYMFLYFGYIDEELAGADNAIQLYLLAQQARNHGESGLYTLYDWLCAIHRGEKEPCRNEFEQEYAGYIHAQTLSGDITKQQEQLLLSDTMEKVRYELHNMVPSVNKITFGRITTFCPLFTGDNVLKNLKDSFVTASAVGRVLQQIRHMDYTAFYRESLDTEHIEIMGKEPIHLEFLPDIILMPNVGIRGVMWQEIEGKRRNTPGRMMLSIFHLEDLNTTLSRLTGEFRWEMCKRVQGGRWNDVSERSLTSEYFDYIQFYRKNPDLSTEAKEKLRTNLQRARNSFKEMFVRDYITWIWSEGNGSPRLNKVARRILFTYCPFPAVVLKTLEQNPLYRELLDRHRITTAQRLHRLQGLQKKLLSSGKQVPETLLAEIAYTLGDIAK